ncbi:MAG TPA: L,D-transpeptidase [Chloroflexota bacterium]|jgi:hypothetical protein|nr:L,D-transpeptidase [Chloroflexota bacterium]
MFRLPWPRVSKSEKDTEVVSEETSAKKGKLRFLKFSPLVLVVLLGAAGGSIWAHGVIAEGLAHSGYTNAGVALNSDLSTALHDGFLPSELQPYSQQLVRIESMPVPQDTNFWSASRQSFYTSETTKLRALDKQLVAQIDGETSAARTLTAGLLHTFHYQLHLAKRGGLNLPKYVRKYRGVNWNFSHSARLSQFRALSGILQPQLRALQTLVGARQAELKSLLHQIKPAHHRLQAIRNEIHARVSAAQSELNMLGLFNKHPGLTSWLGRAATWALQRHKVRLAAIGAADVGLVETAIKARLKQVAPAKWIYISTEGEYMNWYQGSHQMGTSLVTTGNPALPTVTGRFTIFAKFSPFTFKSSDPPGSQYWYPPSPVSYAMEFQNAGYFIHDAPWRSAYGPGTDGPGQPGTNYGGTHGCVNVPYNVAQFLYGWAPLGTTVVVV